MSYSSGEAAEQVVRMTLNGVEVAAKISGKAAERLAVLLYAVLKDQKKTSGKTRLNSMLRSGKELKVFVCSFLRLSSSCALPANKSKEFRLIAQFSSFSLTQGR